MFWASDSAKATLEETTAPVVGLLLSAASWVKDCVQALLARITGAYSRSCIAMQLHTLTIVMSHALLARLLYKKRFYLVGNTITLPWLAFSQAASGAQLPQRRFSSRWHRETLG